MPISSLRSTCLLVLLALTAACGPQRRVSDADINILEKVVSPDAQHTLLIYNFDIGALGYSRTWWAVVPASHGSLNLVNYELPDTWRAVGWSSAGELLVQKWKPYYNEDRRHNFVTGEMFHGVSIRVVEPSPDTGASR